MMRNLTLVTVLLLLVASPLVGQELVPGDMVRVTAPSVSADRFVATFRDTHEDGSVVLGVGGSQRTIPLSDLAKLEVYEGRKGRFWKGAGIGFATVTTFVTILCARSDYQPQQMLELATCTAEWSNFDALVWGSLVGLVVGFPLGGAIGALIRYDSWEPVALRAQPLVAVHPNGPLRCRRLDPAAAVAGSHVVPYRRRITTG